MNSIVVEPFTPKFSEQVPLLIVSIQRDEFGIPIDLAAQPDLQNIAEYYQHGLGNFWIARLGTKVVGTVALLDIENGNCALRKMFVAPEFRGESGVAARLLGAVIDWAMERGVRQIELGTTDRFLAAHRFYEKHGFQLIAKESLAANFPIMKVDSRFYRLTLDGAL